MTHCFRCSGEKGEEGVTEREEIREKEGEREKEGFEIDKKKKESDYIVIQDSR